MKKSLKILAVTALLLQSACSNAGNFEGKWKRIDGDRSTIEIVKSNDVYVMETHQKEWFTGQDETKKLALKRDGDTLKLDAGPLSATITYIKSDDSLMLSSIMGTEEYKRVSK